MNLNGLLLSIPIWWLNGVLALLYWSVAHLAELASLVAGMLILFGFDPILQQRASQRPRRQDRGAVQTSSPNAQYFTLATLTTWMAVSLSSSFPVPWIGALLWWLGLLAILAVPEERFNQMWWAKTGILVYAGIVVGLRFGLGALNQANPADWASVVGSQMDAQAALTSTRGNIATLGMLFVFILYPLGYTSLLLNRFLRNPKPLFNLGLEASDVIQRLRVRR